MIRWIEKINKEEGEIWHEYDLHKNIFVYLKM